jgi:hypothetical protein
MQRFLTRAGCPAVAAALAVLQAHSHFSTTAQLAPLRRLQLQYCIQNFTHKCQFGPDHLPHSTIRHRLPLLRFQAS